MKMNISLHSHEPAPALRFVSSSFSEELNPVLDHICNSAGGEREKVEHLSPRNQEESLSGDALVVHDILWPPAPVLF
jgi:hypothetical protein